MTENDKCRHPREKRRKGFSKVAQVPCSTCGVCGAQYLSMGWTAPKPEEVR